jgi:hypothetical protein
VPQHRNTFSLTLDDLQKEAAHLINPTSGYARKIYWTNEAYRNLAIFTRVVSSTRSSPCAT